MATTLKKVSIKTTSILKGKDYLISVMENPSQLDQEKPQIQSELSRMTIKNIGDFFDDIGLARINLRVKQDYIDRFIAFLETLKEGSIPLVHQPLGPKQKPATIRDRIITKMRSLEEAPRAALNPSIRSVNYTYPNDVAKMIRDHVYIRNQKSPLTLYPHLYPIEIIMTSPESFVDSVLLRLGYPNFKGDSDEKIQLIWWEFVYNVTDKSPLSVEEQDYILRAPDLTSLIPNYTGPSDRASLTWSLIRGYRAPTGSYLNERYTKLFLLHTNRVAQLAVHLHDFYGQNRWPSVFTMYRHLAISEPSVMDPFIETYEGDPFDFAKDAGMVFPSRIDDKHDRAEIYYLNNISYYNDIFDRPDNILPLGDLTGLPPYKIKEILQMFPDKEIIERYEPSWEMGDWRDRPYFIDKIIDDARRYQDGPHWTFRHKWCSNDDRFNILTLDVREKDAPEDPIISYGSHTEYRCYNLLELEDVFREDPELGFVFGVPDYKTGDVLRTFPLASIQELRQVLLDAHDPLYEFLIQKIDRGLDYSNQAVIRVKSLRNDYEQMKPEQQDLVKDYLVWLFLLGMKMRYWKGPPNPYPIQYITDGSANITVKDSVELCSEKERENIFKDETVLRNRMLEVAESKRWLLDLPRIRYNFQTGETAVGKETINTVIQYAQAGHFCLGDLSNQASQTAYYFLIKLLRMNEGQLNQLIQERMPLLYSLYYIPAEKGIINNIEHDLRQVKPALDTDQAFLENIINRYKLEVTGLELTKESLQKIIDLLKPELDDIQSEYLEDLKKRVSIQPPFVTREVIASFHRDPEHILEEY